MTRDMSHDEASESLAGAALDALSADEQSAVLAHAAGCPRCGPELDALRQALAALGNSTPARPTPASPEVEQRLQRIRARLLARAQADRSPLPVTPLAPRRVARAPWLAAAAAVVIAVLLFNQQRSTAAALAAANQNAAATSATLDTARATIAQQEREIRDLTGPNTSVVSMSTSGAAEATAMMFWDKTNNDWSFYAHRLPAAPRGKTYQIWLLTTTGEKISAGTFTPATDSSAEVHAKYPLSPSALKGVAVSEEPAGGMPQPTGRIVLLGAPGPK